jgi:hypothetical protein
MTRAFSDLSPFRKSVSSTALDSWPQSFDGSFRCGTVASSRSYQDQTCDDGSRWRKSSNAPLHSPNGEASVSSTHTESVWTVSPPALDPATSTGYEPKDVKKCEVTFCIRSNVTSYATVLTDQADHQRHHEGMHLPFPRRSQTCFKARNWSPCCYAAAESWSTSFPRKVKRICPLYGLASKRKDEVT